MLELVEKEPNEKLMGKERKCKPVKRSGKEKVLMRYNIT